jgi:hypothetical protein
MHRLTAILVMLLATDAAMAGDPFEIQLDDGDDSCWRRTDPGADGPINPDQVRPEFRSLTLSKWSCNSPATDPFNGSASNLGNDLFRLDLVIHGLVNPPGALYDPENALSPFQYGPSPLLAFVEINVDRRANNGGRDTGGDMTIEAGSHYLANVGRFGGLPSSSTSVRTITRPGDFDSDFFTAPQFERSGAEFVFKLCGCEPITVVSTSVPGDTVFSAGDTWVVRGHFFERTSGFNSVSLMTCPPQRYSSLVSVQFSHNVSTDNTTVSMVYAINQAGAAQLAGLGSEPPINHQVGCDGNEGSVHEALKDIADGATLAADSGWWGVDLPTQIMSAGWAHRTSFSSYLDPTEWRTTVLVGSTYSRTIDPPSADGAQFVWSDVSDTHSGDINGDGEENSLDRNALLSFITANDSADGVIDGQIATPDFGVEFYLQDLNYDGVVDCHDAAIYGGNPCCPADWNGENGLGIQDLFDFLSDWFAGTGDYNHDGMTSIQDIFDYLTAYFMGC